MAVSANKLESRLRAGGFALPNSRTAARQIVSETQAAIENRNLTASMRHTGSTTRQAAGGDIQLALPKVRKPMATLDDKNIPYDTADPKKLKEIRRWARLFYTTHDLIPLLIDIYSRFPVVGAEIVCKDEQLAEFYTDMFFNQLDYETFLTDLGREYFIAGEANSLAHFDETLGVWSSEEILNPDQISVSKNMFRNGERVQLRVKEIVEAIRDARMSNDEDESTRSEKLEKNYEYQQLQDYYPEIIEAANTNDGLDISDALISRIVNKVQAWDTRGTPHLLRSFRTLMMEESLNAAQDAVADRLYSPFILATLGIQNLGDNEPWIPTQTDIDEMTGNMQTALAADFRLLVHHFGLQVTSVFGRESVPRFDQDYARIDKKLMQAWGIGEALISGGGSQTYASSALNREFVTQMMLGFQKAIKKHMRKRMEVIAEAQGHFDYELKGGVRTPVYREILEEDPNTGEQYTRKVPKLLIPEVRMSTLNLRDEAQERQFLQQLRSSGVPISDGQLAVNIPIDFTEELEKQSEEKVEKLVAEAQAMDKAFKLIVKHGLPVPPELAKYIAASEQLKKERAETDAERAKADILDETGMLPGRNNNGTDTDGDGRAEAPDGPAPAPGGGGGDAAGSGGSGMSGGEADPAKNTNPFGVDLDNGIGQDMLDNSDADATDIEKLPLNIPTDGLEDNVRPLVPRNRTRPQESDEQRSRSPRAAKFGEAPSSYGAVRNIEGRRAQAVVRAAYESGTMTVRELVATDRFFDDLNRESYKDQLRNDIDAIYTSIHLDRDGNARLASTAHDAAESFDVLNEMLMQYTEVYGQQPEW